MKRARRNARVARQIVAAQQALGEALIELVVATETHERFRGHMAEHYVRAAAASVARAARGLELMRQEETRELRALDAALEEATHGE